MKFFSLVVSTKGRTQELAILFASLASQSFRDFEVIVVDENEIPRLESIIEQPWGFELQHVRAPGTTGASRGRNIGWRRASGEYLLFPDDDCWYPADFLARAHEVIRTTGAEVLTGRAADREGRSINGRFEARAQWVGRERVWTTSIEWVAFFRRELFERLGGFDEEIGVGAETPWQSCEGQDLVLRALTAGASCWYDPDLYGHHPLIDTRQPDQALITKGRAYARGMGFVLRKHGFGWPARLYWAGRPLMNAAVWAAFGKSHRFSYYLNVAAGRLEGARAKCIPARPLAVRLQPPTSPRVQP